MELLFLAFLCSIRMTSRCVHSECVLRQGDLSGYRLMHPLLWREMSLNVVMVRSPFRTHRGLYRLNHALKPRGLTIIGQLAEARGRES
jgi:hypothetical protein